MAVKARDPVVTKSLLDSTLNRALKGVVDEIAGIIGDFSQQVDEWFNRVETRLDKVEVRLAGVETRLDQVETHIAELQAGQARLLDTLDHFLKRLDDIEQDNVARDAQLARLERWIQQVAKKTGIKLEY